MCSNARFLVSGFHCECLLPNKEEKSEEAWELVFSFGHFEKRKEIEHEEKNIDGLQKKLKLM